MGAFVKIVLWSIVYFCIISQVIREKLSVSPFRYPYFHVADGDQWGWRSPFQDCVNLFDQFFAGTWRIDTALDAGILLIFLLYYPVWIGICWLLCRSGKKNKAKKPAPKPVEENKTPMLNAGVNFKSQRPRALPSGLYGTMPAQQRDAGKEASPAPAPASAPGPAEGVKPPSVNVPEVPRPSFGNEIPDTRPPTPSTQSSHRPVPPQSNARVRDVLVEIAQRHDLALYDNLALTPGEPLVPFSLAMDDCAFLCDVVDDPQAEWIPDDACDPQDTAYWFSAAQQVPSPFQRLAKQALALSQEDVGDARVIPVVILASGNIVGADSMISVWMEKGGMVVRLDETVACPELPLLADYVADMLEKNASKASDDDESEEDETDEDKTDEEEFSEDETENETDEAGNSEEDEPVSEDEDESEEGPVPENESESVSEDEGMPEDEDKPAFENELNEAAPEPKEENVEVKERVGVFKMPDETFRIRARAPEIPRRMPVVEEEIPEKMPEQHVEGPVKAEEPVETAEDNSRIPLTQTEEPKGE